MPYFASCPSYLARRRANNAASTKVKRAKRARARAPPTPVAAAASALTDVVLDYAVERLVAVPLGAELEDGFAGIPALPTPATPGLAAFPWIGLE